MKEYYLPALLAALMLPSGTALAKSTKSVSIDCNLPQQSVQAAVDDASPGVLTTIHIVGECNEDVTITSPGITLDGDPTGFGVVGGAGTIDGQVTVAGAGNVAIRFLTVTGPGHGIEVTDGADVEITGGHLDENESTGLVVSNAAVVSMTGTFITDNGSFDDGDVPVINSIEPSSGFDGGIALYRNAVAKLHCNNVISGNAGVAVQLEDSSVLHQRCEPTTGGGSVVPDLIQAHPAVENAVLIIFNGSTVDLYGATVAGQSLVYANSSLRADTSLITGGIEANAHALVGFRGGVDFTGTLTCDETSGALGVLLGFGGIACDDTDSGTGDPEVPDINQ